MTKTPLTYESVIDRLRQNNPECPAVSLEVEMAANTEEEIDQLIAQGKDSYSLFLSARRRGHAHIMEYLDKKNWLSSASRLLTMTDRMEFEMQFIDAARRDHVDVMEFYRKRGDERVLKGCLERAAIMAAAPGHVDVLRYLRGHGFRPDVKEEMLTAEAVKGGQIGVLDYLEENGVQMALVKDMMAHEAVRWRKVPVLDWLERKGFDVGAAIEEGKNNVLFAQSLKWWRMHGRNDLRLDELSPYLFRPKAYDDVVGMMEKEGYTEPAPVYAYHTAGLFGTTARVLAYLDRWGQAGRQPLHDIIHDIKLPQKGRFNAAAWADAVLKHGPKMARLVRFADKLPEPLKDKSGAWSYRATRDEVAKFAYQQGAQHPELARLCLEFLCDEQTFNKALGYTEMYRMKMAAANDNEKPNAHIPDIQIDGAEFDKPDHRFYKLPSGDIRGLLLGQFTNCCQHIDGAGISCAVHGFFSPHSGFYVVADKKTDLIVAQSWAWRGTKGELVLDSLESLSGHMRAEQWKSLCGVFAQQARRGGVPDVLVGTGGQTPGHLGEPAADPAYPRPEYGDGYRDSRSQYRIR